MSRADRTVPTASTDTFPAGRSVLVLSRFGVFRKALPAAGRWIVGRGEDCDVRIEDSKASRQHCALVFDDELAVVDLGSTNGTLLGERRLPANEPTPFRFGQPITIGGTVVMVQAEEVEAPPIAILSEDVFRDRAESERIDAERSGQTFALAHVRFEAVGAAGAETRSRSVAQSAVEAVAHLESGLREVVRPGDALTYAGPGEYLVLLVGATAEVAEHYVEKLRDSLDARRLPAAVGASVYPRDGRTIAQLRAAALGALRTASDPSAPRVQLDRGVLDRLAPLIERVASGKINVLVLGETGVGKEVLARTLHARSPRAAAAMVSINCAAIAESVLESELFGHEKGAFTGAVQPKVGLLESADGGTVFLDEVGEMPASLQAKLLRVLELREVMRVGAVRARAIDVRFIAATNRDLEAEVAAGRFRADLYYRLNGMTLTIPPLRERVDEIEPLARAFATRAAETSDRKNAPSLSAQVVAVLRAYPWPGNIRELRNVIERAVLLASDDLITLEHLSLARLVRPLPPTAPSASVAPGTEDAAAAARVTLPPGTPLAPLARRVPARDPEERARIEEALAQCGGNQSKAATLLGVSRRTLVSRIVEHGIRRPRDE